MSYAQHLFQTDVNILPGKSDMAMVFSSNFAKCQSTLITSY